MFLYTLNKSNPKEVSSAVNSNTVCGLEKKLDDIYIWVMGFEMRDEFEEVDVFRNMATAIFRAAGEPAR